MYTHMHAHAPQSAMTLFGMMNGDSLHNLIGAARWRGGEGLWGALTLAYFFSYIALAIYVVRPPVKQARSIHAWSVHPSIN